MKIGRNSLVARKNLTISSWMIGSVVMTTIGSQLSLPIQPVPVTFQTFAVMAAGLMAGYHKQTPLQSGMAQVGYLALGAFGLPVFAGFAQGAHHLVGPTAGYLWSFPVLGGLSALIGGWLRRTLENGGSKANWAGAGVATMLSACLTLGFGTLWLAGFTGWEVAANTGFSPFVLIEVVKSVLAVSSLAGLARLSASA